MKVIKINNLSVNYESTKALVDVSFDIHDKEFLGIIGPNGGGKTTLIKSILKLVKPSMGSIEINEKAVIGYVPQLTTFDRGFPITVSEVILSGHLPRKPKLFHSFRKHEQKHANEVMKQLRIKSLANRQIGQLSGGQMQKVLIARALMNHPTVLMLDEPTAGVDEESRLAIYDMLKELNQDITIVIVSHQTEELMSYLDRVIYINQKVHIHDGTSDIEVNTETCPIDWFIKGKAINENMLRN